jgi:choline dehydrogenase
MTATAEARLQSVEPSCDTIIVGAGSAGCVLAHRLSADRSHQVLLLEAGPLDRRLEIRIPAAFAKLFHSELDWNDYSEADGPVPAQFCPRGKVVGGSSSLNAMMAVRGHRSDFDAWEAAGNPGWGFANVLPYFRRLESRPGGDPALRGLDGPIPVNELRSPNEMTLAFLAAAEQSGLERNGDYNGHQQDGVALTQVTQRRGRRWSAADAYLRPARGRPNLRLETEAMVIRLLLASDGPRPRVVGVVWRRGGEEHVAVARREVILCAGAYNSPQLLLLSGIGPTAALAALELPVIADLPGVGENLQDHPTFATTYECPRAVSLAQAERPLNLLRYLLLRRGPLTSNVAEGIAFVHTRPGLATPDIELLFAPTFFMTHGEANPPGDGFTIGTMLLRPHSRGRLSLRSRDPAERPRIEPRFFSAGDDLERLVAGVHIARRIAAAPALAPYRGAEVWPGAARQTDEELADFVTRHFQVLYHPSGTCRMGSDPGAVVDAQLRVHGVDGLRVVDASVMPTLPGGHPHLPTMMIAERAAALIAQER